MCGCHAEEEADSVNPEKRNVVSLGEIYGELIERLTVSFGLDLAVLQLQLRFLQSCFTMDSKSLEMRNTGRKQGVFSRTSTMRVAEIPSIVFGIFGVFALRAISIVARKGKMVVDNISTATWCTQSITRYPRTSQAPHHNLRGAHENGNYG